MRLAIRADGSPDIGYGHLVRTGAIADTFIREGHSVTYCTRNPESVRKVCPCDVSVLPIKIRRDESNVGWLEETNPDLVLSDTYSADTDYQRAISDATVHAVIADDNRFVFCADFVINGNVYSPYLQYDWVGSEPTWCLGTDYLPIRREIRKQRSRIAPVNETPKRAMIMMGGSDINDTTPRVIRSFDGMDLIVTVIVGPGFTNQDRIASAAETTDASFEIRENPEELAYLMASADLAVSAAGSTIYELLALGTPTIAIPQADNQELIAAALKERGVIESLSADQIETLPRRIEALYNDDERRRIYGEGGMSLVDCRGSVRIYEEITSD